MKYILDLGLQTGSGSDLPENTDPTKPPRFEYPTPAQSTTDNMSFSFVISEAYHEILKTGTFIKENSLVYIEIWTPPKESQHD